MRRAALVVLGVGMAACHGSTLRPATLPAAPDAPARASSETPSPQADDDGEPATTALTGGASPGAYDADDEELDDEPVADTDAAHPGQVLVEHPFANWNDAQIEARVKEQPESLGSMSIGSPSGGALRGGVRMPEGEAWELVDPDHAWGSEETVNYLKQAILRVHQELPGSPKLYIGHISGKNGGHLRPHISHQSGRDVDISFFYTGPGSWYARAHAGNLDRARTWAFVKALLCESDVEMILIDHSIQALLKEHALARGEDPAWLARIFNGAPGEPPVIRHAPGHATHLHIRFFNPLAQETARRAYPFLIKHKQLQPPQQYITHLVKPGETLGMLARKYGTTVEAIKRANGLKNSKIRAKRGYRIPTAGRGRLIASGRNPLLIPKRRVPPQRTSQPAAETRAAR